MLRLKPISLRDANEYVRQHHRHHKPVAGHKFSIGCEADGELVGVIIAGRPVSRYLDDGFTLEVTRLCTNGEKNACSFLYGAAARAAAAMGYKRIITYTLESENGASLRASGWICQGKAGGLRWTGKRQPKEDQYPAQMKLRYEKQLRKEETVNVPKAGTFGATRSNAVLLSERRKQSMAFVPVPKDLNRVKTKVMFNLTKRQLICFSIAAAVGVPIFFLAKAHLDLSTAAMLMVVIMLPFIFFALYEKDGQPAEKYLYHIVQSMFIRDKVRPYRTNNLYAEIQQKIKEQEELQLEQQHSKGKA